MIKNIFLDAGGVILNEETFENISANIITGIVKCFNEPPRPEGRGIL